MSETLTRHISKGAYATLRERLKEYKQEYAQLCAQLIELRDLKDADEYDLSEENVRLAFLEKEIAVLTDEVAHSKIREEAPQVGLVQLGSIVYLQASDNAAEMKCTVVSPIEADPLKGKISDKSPLGKALLGRMKNELVKVWGPHKDFMYRILDIQQA